MQEELNQFKRNDVWYLVPCPKDSNVFGTKWIFRNKTDEKEQIMLNKARLVAQGYTQIEGLDFDETFASVARLESVRLLSIACHLRFKLHPMDVKSTFLNSVLQKEVYVEQPARFQDHIYPNHVYRLKKALYGLKQALRACRPYISFSVGLCARFQSDSKESHLLAMKRILCYVNGTKNFGLYYSFDSNVELAGYSNADWARNIDDRKSTTGGCFYIGNNLVSWFSKKQNCVSLSTAEAKYIAAGSCCTQLLWMKQMLNDYGIRQGKMALGLHYLENTHSQLHAKVSI
ncbi:unnamed protein product [Prunus brigantina]